MQDESAAWNTWIGRHRTTFGLTAPDDAAMLVEWVKLFIAQGFTPAELDEASTFLAMNDVPRFRAEHLEALQKRVRAQCRPRPPPMPTDERGECVLCFGAGRVVVPNPRTLGGPVWYTQAVLCRCALGRWFRDNGPAQQTLEDYERQVPDWRERMRAHDKLLQQRQEVGSMTAAIDHAMGRIRARVRQREQEANDALAKKTGS